MVLTFYLNIFVQGVNDVYSYSLYDNEWQIWHLQGRLCKVFFLDVWFYTPKKAKCFSNQKITYILQSGWITLGKKYVHLLHNTLKNSVSPAILELLRFFDYVRSLPQMPMTDGHRGAIKQLYYIIHLGGHFFSSAMAAT